jgi:hypothetical protein
MPALCVPANARSLHRCQATTHTLNFKETKITKAILKL